MDLIIGERGSGKTTALILKAAEEDKYILCSDRRRATNIFRLSEDMRKAGLIPRRIRYPVTANEILKLRFDTRFEYLLDDAEDFIQSICGVRISCATITPEKFMVLDGKRKEQEDSEDGFKSMIMKRFMEVN